MTSMKMKWVCLGLAALSLAACDQLGIGKKKDATGSAADETKTASISMSPGKKRTGSPTFTCADGRSFTVKFRGENAQIVLPDGTLTLQPWFAAKGTRHSDSFVTLYTDGDDAFVEQGGQPFYQNCKIKK
jgi:membrane-bound inhibitor of C-type lysozyme